MAGAIGNKHFLQAQEWVGIATGKVGPWARCAVDMARIHPGGGPLQVLVVADGAAPLDVTAWVVAATGQMDVVDALRDAVIAMEAAGWDVGGRSVQLEAARDALALAEGR
jgi:hypothetical protein